jgi:hypothetical protein
LISGHRECHKLPQKPKAKTNKQQTKARKKMEWRKRESLVMETGIFLEISSLPMRVSSALKVHPRGALHAWLSVPLPCPLPSPLEAVRERVYLGHLWKAHGRGQGWDPPL